MQKYNKLDIPKGWIMESLKDSIYIKARIGWKGLKKSEYVNFSQYRIINGSNVINGKVDWERCGYISKERYDESPEIMLQKNDIVMTKDGTIGKVAFVDKVLEKSTVASGLFVLRVDIDKIYNKYLYYYLISPSFRTLCNSRIEGSVIPHLYQRDLINLEIPLPPLDDQIKIANILSSLDDKIELNNKINKNLEEMAQALYKQWFVDFDFPNINREPYKSSGGEMIESELGLIPIGWEIFDLGSILKFVKGKKPKIIFDKFVSQCEEYLTLDVLKGKTNLFADSTKTILVDKLDVTMVMDGASSGMIYYGKSGILSSTLALVRITNNNYKSSYIYSMLSNFEDSIKSKQTGSAIPHTDKNYVLTLKVAINTGVANHFNSIVENYRNKIINNKEENLKLAELRDTLLPKLMNGELKVPTEG